MKNTYLFKKMFIVTFALLLGMNTYAAQPRQSALEEEEKKEAETVVPAAAPTPAPAPRQIPEYERIMRDYLIDVKSEQVPDTNLGPVIGLMAEYAAPSWLDPKASMEEIKLEGHTKPVIRAAISSDNSLIVTGSDDKTARVWDAKTGVLRHILTGHRNFVSAVAISLDNSLIVTGSWDETTRIWDAKTGKELLVFTLPEQLARAVDAVAISANKEFIVTAYDGGEIRIWDIKTGLVRHTLIDNTKEQIESITISPDGTIITRSGNTVQIWDSNKGELVSTFINPHENLLSRLKINKSSQGLKHFHVRFMSADNSFVITRYTFGTDQLWNTHTGELEITFPGDVAALSADNTIMVIIPREPESQKTPEIWRLAL